MNRTRLYGARLNRMICRVMIFGGMLILFSLAFGGAAETDGSFLYGALLVAALGIGIVILWFKSRPQRELDRSHQLAAETALLCPSAPAEEMNHTFTLLCRREMRLEALLYLVFSILAGLWFWGMYLVNASPVSWKIGWGVMVPGLLLISLVLLVRSILPFQKQEGMPGVSRLEMEETQRALNREDTRTEERSSLSRYSVSLSRQRLTAWEYMRNERKEALGSFCLLLTAVGFFGVLPLALLIFDVYVVRIGKAPSWSLMMFAGIALLSLPLCFILFRAGGGMRSLFECLSRYLDIRNRKLRGLADRIQSYKQERGEAEIVFQQSGTVRFPCDSDTYNRLFSGTPHEAILVMFENRIQSIVLLPDAGQAWVQQDILQSDEALRQAVKKEIDLMQPARRAEMEAEIREVLDWNDVIREKGYSGLTTLEQGKFHAAAAMDLRHSNADVELSAVESSVMESLDLSRQEIMNMKKNPFAHRVLRKLLTAAAIEILGVLVTAAVEKNTGVRLGFVHLAISALTGLLALCCAEDIVHMRQFRRLQKAYRDPAYRKKVLDAAVYREIREQAVRQRTC